jgi:CYTH domain-containing protein
MDCDTLPAFSGRGRDDIGVVARVPGEGKYARLEREQRWVVAELPAHARSFAGILDRYILGTRLRLRRVDTGEHLDFKLAQKVRRDEADPEIVKLTNIYLSAEEYDVVTALPAAELRKTRWRVNWNGRRLVVDQFHDRFDGLLLAEAELNSDDARLPIPPFAVSDVTNDDRYSGGALAAASDQQVRLLLCEVAAMRAD